MRPAIGILRFLTRKPMPANSALGVWDWPDKISLVFKSKRSGDPAISAGLEQSENPAFAAGGRILI